MEKNRKGGIGQLIFSVIILAIFYVCISLALLFAWNTLICGMANLPNMPTWVGFTLTAFLFIVAIVRVFINVKNANQKDEYTLGGYQLKSIKSVVGKRSIVSIYSEPMNELKEQTIVYRSKTIAKDLKQYVKYLKSEGFIVQKGTPRTLIKKIDDTDYTMVVILEEEPRGYKITLQKKIEIPEDE